VTILLYFITLYYTIWQIALNSGFNKSAYIEKNTPKNRRQNPYLIVFILNSGNA